MKNPSYFVLSVVFYLRSVIPTPDREYLVVYLTPNK